MKNECDVLIAGAGIGGLALALSLHQADISCQIYESVQEIKSLGAGINLLNRVAPPDTILEEVHDLTGRKPFNRLEDFISRTELPKISSRYKGVAGFKVEDLQRTPAASGH
jgi:flavin-dependent dehydrogenase